MQIVERYGRPAVGLVAIVILALIALQAVPLSMGTPRGAAGPRRSPRCRRGRPRCWPAPAAKLRRRAQLRNRLQAETTERPETTAQVLRAWLSEN